MASSTPTPQFTWMPLTPTEGNALGASNEFLHSASHGNERDGKPARENCPKPNYDSSHQHSV